MNRRVPVLVVSAPAGDWLRFIQGEGASDAFRHVLRVESVEDRPSARRLPEGARRRNSSAWRVDAALRPSFSYVVGLFEENFQSSLYIGPEFTMSPFHGVLATAGWELQIYDEIEPCENGKRTDNFLEDCPAVFRLNRAALSWGGWLPVNTLGAASAGVFPDERYGLAAELSHLFWKGQIEVIAGGDVSGELEFFQDTVEYSNIDVWSAFLGITHRPIGLDLETSVRAGRFQEDSFAVKLDVARRFGEAEVGFFAAKNEFDDLVGARIRVALPVRKYLRPKAFRPSTVPDFSLSYEEESRDVAATVSFFDDVDRLRKRLYPPYLLNNLDVLRKAAEAVGEKP